MRGGTGIIAISISIVLMVSAVPIARFYQSYWVRLRSIPSVVIYRESQSGGDWTSLRRISPWMTKAIIATEDRSFYSNLGVSFEGIGRALVVDLKSGTFAQGGSTITQELARNTMLSPVKRFRRKVAEALLAVMMTVLYSKNQILSLYLNQVYLGDGAFGVDSAAERYFGVSPARLTLPQAALLAGLPQAPSSYNPFIHFRLAKERQRLVLQSMVADHQITSRQARHAYHAPLHLKN